MDTNEMEYRMSSDPNFPQSRGCPYFSRDHDRLPLPIPHPHAYTVARPAFPQQYHYHINNNHNSGTPYGSDPNYNHPARPNTQSLGQPQHTVHPRAQPPHANHINHTNNTSISSSNHDNTPHPRLPLPLYDPVHANNNNNSSNSSNNSWFQQGLNQSRHAQTQPAGVPTPPLSQMNSEGNPAPGAADSAGSSSAPSGNAGSAGSTPDGLRGQESGAAPGSGPGSVFGAPAPGRGPAAGNATGNATGNAAGGPFHSGLAPPGGANGQSQEMPFSYDPPALGGPGSASQAYHLLSGTSRQPQHRSQAALASHLSQLNYRLAHDTHQEHQHQLYNQPPHQQQHQPPQQRRHRATSSIGRSHQPASSLRGPSLPALAAPFHTPISVPAMSSESTAPAESGPNAPPSHAHDVFYGTATARESRHRPSPSQYSMPAADEGLGMSYTAPPASAPSADSSPTAEHRRNQAQARLRNALLNDYDSGDEPYDVDDMMADDEATMRFIDQISHEAGGARQPQRYSAPPNDEARIRQQQLLRGQLSTKRVASKRALSQLQSIDIASLDESERTCVICYNDFGVPSPEGVQESPLRLPNCQHVFGEHCIKKWFEESDSCPYCRDKVHSESVTVPSSSVRQYLARHHGRHLPQLLRHGGALPHPSYNSGDDSPPRTWQTGDRRSPPSDPADARRRTRSRLNSARLSASSAMASALGAPQPSQTQPPSHDRPNMPHASSWSTFSGSSNLHGRHSMPGPPRMYPFGPGYQGGASFMPPMHLQPGSMPSAQGHHGPGFGFDAHSHYQAPSNGGESQLSQPEPMHSAYSSTLPPSGPADGGSSLPATTSLAPNHTSGHWAPQ